MQVRRVIGVGTLALALLATGCSSGGKGKAAPTSRPVLSFGLGQDNTDPLGVCRLFSSDSIKKLVGGGKKFRIYPPQSVAGRNGPNTGGVECSWDRSSAPDQVSLRITTVDYSKAASGLIDTAWASQTSALGKTTPVPGVGDQGVSASSSGINTVLVRKGPFLVTAASQARGGSQPIAGGTLSFLAGVAIRKVAP
jgi:hypothetical protein